MLILSEHVAVPAMLIIKDPVTRSISPGFSNKASSLSSTESTMLGLWPLEVMHCGKEADLGEWLCGGIFAAWVWDSSSHRDVCVRVCG